MKPLNDDKFLWSVQSDRAADALTGESGPACCWYYGCCWFWAEASAAADNQVAA